MRTGVIRMQKLEGLMRAALDKYEMLSPNDRIAVGVSGGKDSLVLLCALAHLREYHPIPFTVTAITIDPCFEGIQTDYTGIEALCASLKVPFLVRRSRLGTIVFEERKEPNPCSLCARMRRAILHNMAKEAGCNKLALGHHFDDAVQTFMMNLFYGGKIGCFAPKTYLSRKDLTMIRPMLFCPEQDIARAAKRLSLPVAKSRCPVDGNTCRAQTAALLADLEKQFPDLRAKIMGAMQRAGIDGWGIPSVLPRS